MSGRRYPPLTPDEVRDILRAKGFTLDRTRGSHEQWRAIIKNQPRVVTVDAHYQTFDQSLIKRMIFPIRTCPRRILLRYQKNSKENPLITNG
jgi:predicted RNA binding protein YcfA (HicA-like mRNA interferase family)